MSRERDRLLATGQRCEAICDRLGIPRSVDGQFVRNLLERFADRRHGVDPDPNWQRRGYALSQAFHCHFPDRETVARLRSAFSRGGAAEVHARLRESPLHASAQATAPLVDARDSRLLVDVTSTAQIGFTSGIQRVVRSLGHHFHAVDPSISLIRWDQRRRCFTPLSDRELESLLAPPAPPPSTPEEPGLPSAAARLLHGLGQAASWPRRRIERTIHKRRRRRAERELAVPSVFLWRQPLLLPELLGDEHHIEAVRLLAEAGLVQATMVFYDAIPIRHAEFFLPHSHSMYLRSLSLIRHVAGISCISHAVRENLEHLLAVMPRHGRPAIDVHYLGADFPAAEPADQLPGRSVPVDRPLVLCVGTVEPRKNQARTLRAMIAAQQDGGRFTGVFAGNAGWLNGAFRAELAAAVAAGHDLQLHEHLDDHALCGLYQQAAFTVYCSLDEGFGLPIIESLEHGRPCVTGDRGSMREIAEQTGGCVLVDPEDTAAMAAAIGGLLADEDVLAGLRREAQTARWPSWRDYTERLVRFATRPAAEAAARGRRAA
jgi:glycosyltransferase involved in cell wall biosynthesis